MAERRLVVNGIQRPYMDILHWVGLATVAHLPAAVAPVMRTEIGPDGEERTVPLTHPVPRMVRVERAKTQTRTVAKPGQRLPW
jgi:hypothetical protein